MRTLHGNTTSFMIQCTLNMADDSFKNCGTFCHCAGGQPAVNKAVSPCDLSTVFVQLLLEHRVQVIQTTVDDKTKASNVKYILYKICRQWTRGEVTNCVRYFQQ
jgi:hypothetical protein